MTMFHLAKVGDRNPNVRFARCRRMFWVNHGERTYGSNCCPTCFGVPVREQSAAAMAEFGLREHPRGGFYREMAP